MSYFRSAYFCCRGNIFWVKILTFKRCQTTHPPIQLSWKDREKATGGDTHSLSVSHTNTQMMCQRENQIILEVTGRNKAGGDENKRGKIQNDESDSLWLTSERCLQLQVRPGKNRKTHPGPIMFFFQGR